MHAVCNINIVLIDYKMTTLQAPKITPYMENDIAISAQCGSRFWSRHILGPVYMEVGGPQVDEVTRFGGVTRLSIQSLILI